MGLIAVYLLGLRPCHLDRLNRCLVARKFPYLAPCFVHS